jgi:hypothetical protein
MKELDSPRQGYYDLELDSQLSLKGKLFAGGVGGGGKHFIWATILGGY